MTSKFPRPAFRSVSEGSLCGPEGFTPDAWRDDACTSAEPYPGDEVFLDARSVGAACDLIGISEGARAALVADRDRYDRHPQLKRAVWHCHAQVASVNFDRASIASWPKPKPGSGADLFYAFVVLSLAPRVRALHAARGIPETVTRETLFDLEIWMNDYAAKHGEAGFAKIGWLSNHVRGRLVALGRLQYLVDTFPFAVAVYRNVLTAECRVLAPGGVRYRADGQYDGVGGVRDPEARTTVFDREDGRIRGHLVTRDGRISSETTLSGAWQRVFGRGDKAFSVHIPAGVPLDRAACEASLARADLFLPRHFPEHPFNAYFSDSWLFDNTLAEILPASSNLVQFQSLFHLFPFPHANDNQMMERVFGARYERIEEMPQRSSLQKAIVAHLKKGGHFHHGGMLKMRDDRDLFQGAGHRYAEQG